MQIILINHGERNNDPRTDDRDQPLHPVKGVGQVKQLVDRLQKNPVTPTIYLTSRNAHARETAERLCEALGGVFVELDALTPGQRTETIPDIVEEVINAGHDLMGHAVIAIIGHSPRLEQLFAYLTFRAAAPKRLAYGQEAYLTMEIHEINDFFSGEGKGQWPNK